MSEQKNGVATIDTSDMIQALAKTHGVDSKVFVKTIMKTAFKGSKDPTAEEFTAFMFVAQKYDLDPFMNQIYAFPSKGGIVPFMGIDGWIDMINRQTRHSGLEVIEEEDGEGKPLKTTVSIFVNGYDKPVTISERFSECYRAGGHWDSHPFRALRHKAIIQCARVAYGISGIHDEDEAHRILEARGEAIDVTPDRPEIGEVQAIEPNAKPTQDTPTDKKEPSKGKGKEKKEEADTEPSKGDQTKIHIRELCNALGRDDADIKIMGCDTDEDLEALRVSLKKTLTERDNQK